MEVKGFPQKIFSVFLLSAMLEGALFQYRFNKTVLLIRLPLTLNIALWLSTSLWKRQQ